MFHWQSCLIRSHKIVFNGRNNQPTKAWLFPASIPPGGILAGKSHALVEKPADFSTIPTVGVAPPLCFER